MSDANGKKNGKHPGGRPPLYDTPAKLQAKIDEYFAVGVAKRKVIVGTPKNREVVLIDVPTISGLVLYLGFCDRQSFYAYEKREQFSYVVKKARARICQVYEEQLHTGIPTGGIFALKNLGGWRDRDAEDGKPPPGPAPRFIFNIGTGQAKELSVADLLRQAATRATAPLEAANGSETNGGSSA